MQRVAIRGKWAALACLAVLIALAASLAVVKPALADDDLTATSVELTTQATEATTWPFEVYIQHGSETPTLVKSFTKDEFTKLASDSADPVSGLSWDGSSWYVTTATKYVTLDDLLASAGVQWNKGATLTYENTDTSVSKSITYENAEALYFYPKTERTVRSTSDAVLTDVVFGLANSKDVIIGDSSTADAVQKAAGISSRNDDAVLPVMGSLKSEYDVPSGPTISAERFVAGVNKVTITFSSASQEMYRLYNPNSGEHFYTASAEERDTVKAAGWNYEGVGWKGPVISNTPVYRLYNPNAGDHHYTTSLDERDNLVSLGWNDEGIGWYSDDAKTVGLHRLYNPNAVAGAHHFTTDAAEKDNLVKVGWNYEGTAWYGLS